MSAELEKRLRELQTSHWFERLEPEDAAHITRLLLRAARIGAELEAERALFLSADAVGAPDHADAIGEQYDETIKSLAEIPR